jgi:hypothetical protein
VGQDGKENDKEIHGTDDRALLKIRAAPVNKTKKKKKKKKKKDKIKRERENPRIRNATYVRLSNVNSFLIHESIFRFQVLPSARGRLRGSIKIQIPEIIPRCREIARDGHPRGRKSFTATEPRA